MDPTQVIRKKVVKDPNYIFIIALEHWCIYRRQQREFSRNLWIIYGTNLIKMTLLAQE